MNVLSEFNRRDPEPKVIRWLEAAENESLHTSVLTLGEIRMGIELLPPSKKRTRLEKWFQNDLQDWFEGRILPIDEPVANRWGVLSAHSPVKRATHSALSMRCNSVMRFGSCTHARKSRRKVSRRPNGRSMSLKID